ncbi:hypothetical protein K469DRAFT_678092 [Zopfia rhizophila CBS 207.26]|uniref:Uncharacterized protein n=1 Tax=Zopfia rhizophila CBS 207.26 TaxID=1314779 RepID=A0A6A6DB84_9PEZI|nr:hypothetical protein K469DRAFT_678092 [Zopfia rhizophila CBS 207.26]
MRWRDRAPRYTGIYQTGYSQFFDAYTSQCDEVSFIPWLPNGPKMNKELRSTLNNLVHQTNYVLQYYTNWLNLKYYANRPPGDIRTAPFLDWVDVDIVYNGHRFCRAGVKEPNRHNRDVWFFHFLDGWLKEGSATISAGANGDNQTARVLPEWLAETFHPKSAGHRASKDLLYLKTKFEVFARRLSGKRKWIWMVGDDQCYASQRVDSDFYGGFREPLRQILGDPHFYGWDRFQNPTDRFTPMWIGSQGHLGTQHDCYRGAQINEIHDNIRDSDMHDEAYKQKVVILALGTMDVFLGYDLKNVHRRVGAILRTIFDHDPDAVVLLNHLPMFGKGTQGENLDRKEGLQRVVEFNARLSGLANYWRTRHNRRVLKVSLPLTTWHKRDLFLPSRRGYNAIAWSIAEQLVMAGSMNWITNDRNDDDETPGPAIPGPPTRGGPRARQARSPSPKIHRRDIPDPEATPPQYQLLPDPVKDGTIICTQKRPDGAPGGDDILASLYQGKSQWDWVHQVGCNTTEICKNSLFDTAVSSARGSSHWYKSI